MLIPAIHFSGTCKEAIGLYQRVFDAQVISIAYNRDAPAYSDNTVIEGADDRIMHAEIVVAGTRLNMCDMIDKAVAGNMHLFNVFFDTIEEVENAYFQLAQRGKIITKLGPQFWSAMYGEIEDCYGIRWQLMVKA